MNKLYTLNIPNLFYKEKKHWAQAKTSLRVKIPKGIANLIVDDYQTQFYLFLLLSLKACQKYSYEEAFFSMLILNM